MRARWAALWAAVACAAWTVSGCGEVESCKEGDVGCLGGFADDSGNCRFDLVKDTRGFCVKPGGNQDGGSQSDPCGCSSGSLCQQDGMCVNVCQPPNPVPTLKIAPSACRPAAGETYTLEDAANAACEQSCIRRAEYCGASCNPSTDCTRTLALAVVSQRCAAGMTLECAMQACEAIRDQPCAQVTCATGTPNCTGIVCNDSCSVTDYVKDGLCDDGDLSNAGSSVCDWGTDCGDCGPRRGTPPATKYDLGDPCVDAYQCGGDPDHVASSTGWCVPTETQTNILRCVPDCSATDTCPAGYTCFGLGVDPDDDGPMQQQPVLDPNTGQAARACFPNACGV